MCDTEHVIVCIVFGVKRARINVATNSVIVDVILRVLGAKIMADGEALTVTSFARSSRIIFRACVWIEIPSSRSKFLVAESCV